MTFDSNYQYFNYQYFNYQYFKGYTWSFNGYQKKEKEKGQLAYLSLIHTIGGLEETPLLVMPGPVPGLRVMMAARTT